MSEIKHIIELKLKHNRKMLDKFIKAKNVTAQRDYKIRIHLLEEALEDAEANGLETSENSLHKHIVNVPKGTVCRCYNTKCFGQYNGKCKSKSFNCEARQTAR